MTDNAITLQQYCERLTAAVANEPDLQRIWVTAELSDVRTNSAGHCYMELLQKDERGSDLAKIKAIIWRSNYPSLYAKFFEATGREFATGIKVMVLLSASIHPVYGLSVNINDIDADYTMGDVLRRRREILERLKREGIIDANRQLQFDTVPQRIAVISAAGAAGYGDFINQLEHNPYRLRFKPKLFEATMQGENTVSTVIDALNRIADDDCWDCVVIIRGGGATSDLLAFDNYDLAANVAQFPIPVIVGIGHERDTTVLDDVANQRVKTPTAAAEFLIGFGKAALDRLDALASTISQLALSALSGTREQLAHLQSTLSVLPLSTLKNAESRLMRYSAGVASVGTVIATQRSNIDTFVEKIRLSALNAINRQTTAIDNISNLLNAISPKATLRRGYSITKVDGKAVRSVHDVPDGAVITTVLADGTIISKT